MSYSFKNDPVRSDSRIGAFVWESFSAAEIDPDSLYSNVLMLHKKIVRGHLEVELARRT